MGCAESKPSSDRNSTVPSSEEQLFEYDQMLSERKAGDSSIGKQFDELYELGKELGKGGFAVVREGLHKQSGESYAIKVVQKRGLSKLDEQALKIEIGLQQELIHRHILRIYDVFDEKWFYYLITEKMEGGELFDRIGRKSYYTEKEARDAAKVLFEAIQHCHSHHVAHRDLKPENLLLQSKFDDCDIKIADFGFARKCETHNALHTLCGTPGYMAPEILKRLRYGTQVDMWSLGVIIYILLGGYRPFAEKTQGALFRKIKNGDYKFHVKYWGHISEDAKEMISSLLTVDPNLRATATTVLALDWITGHDDLLSSRNLTLSLDRLKKFNARRKVKAAGLAVLATVWLNNATREQLQIEITSNRSLKRYASF